MFYCFTYPDSVENILGEYFEKKNDVNLIEIIKYKGKEDFYIAKENKITMYLKDGTKMDITGDFMATLDVKNFIKSFYIKVYTYFVTLVRTNENLEKYEKYLELQVGEIINNNKKLGNLLIYKDENVKKILMEIFKQFNLTFIEPTEDVNLNIINILQKLNKF